MSNSFLDLNGLSHYKEKSDSALATALAGKQDTISDLATIRTGAAAGATAYQKPSTGIPASDIASGVIPDVSGKADAATTLAGYGITDAKIESGTITLGPDSITPLTSHQDISGKADKDTDAVEGNFAAFDSSGNPVDSGHKHSDYITSHQDISGKADKVTGATNGNFAGLDANGNLTDSGSKASDFLTSHQDISGKEDKSNKVTAFQVTPDDTHYPSEKLVKDSLDGKQDNMVVLEYGVSTWNDFITAYNKNAIVYCKVPGTGNDFRMAFMAWYTPSGSTVEVEFQYYRSVSSKSASVQHDQVFVYKLTNGNTWTTSTRECVLNIVNGNGIDRSVSGDNMTLSVKAASNGGVTVDSNGVSVTNPLPAPAAADNGKVLSVTDAQGTIGWTTPQGSDVTDVTLGGTSVVDSDGVAELPAYPTTLPASDVYSWAKASTKPSYDYSEIGNTPNLATVATSGSYNDLSNTPTIPDLTDYTDAELQTAIDTAFANM